MLIGSDYVENLEYPMNQIKENLLELAFCCSKMYSK